MEIATYEDLLRAARAQATPQRLLFVFAAAEQPEDTLPERRARFEAGKASRSSPADLPRAGTIRGRARLEPERRAPRPAPG